MEEEQLLEEEEGGLAMKGRRASGVSPSCMRRAFGRQCQMLRCQKGCNTCIKKLKTKCCGSSERNRNTSSQEIGVHCLGEMTVRYCVRSEKYHPCTKFKFSVI